MYVLAIISISHDNIVLTIKLTLGSDGARNTSGQLTRLYTSQQDSWII